MFNFYLKKRDPDTAAPENWRERAMLSIAAVWPCAGGAGSLVFNFPVSACFFFFALFRGSQLRPCGPAQAVPVALSLRL